SGKVEQASCLFPPVRPTRWSDPVLWQDQPAWFDRNSKVRWDPDYLWTRPPATMKAKRELTAIIEREGDGYVSLCPELEVASQGDTIEEARANLIEALELFFETASPEELKDRLHDEVLVTRVKIAV